MLVGLARLLRSGGHDVAVAAAGTSDADVAARAEAEGRCLVTRDRAFAARTPGAVLLEADDPDEQAAALCEALRLDPAPAPFTLCVLDGAVLRTASEAERAAVPAGVSGPVHACPSCGRVYWAGSHLGRMRERLARLAATVRR